MANVISIHGSYFGNNYGDILLVNMFTSWVREVDSEVTINYPLANKKKTRDLPEGSTSFFKLIESKALIYCGGGYFGEQPKNKNKWAIRNFFRHATIGIVARLFRVPYAIIGVEFGPISATWFRKICVFIAKGAKVIVVRNEESKKFLEDNGVIGVVLAADAVLSLSDIVKIERPNNTKKKILIHINGQGVLPPNYLEVAMSIVKGIQRNLNEFELYFISDGDGKYYNNEYCKELFTYLDYEKISYNIPKYEGYKELITLINNADYVFTSKLHVGITAAALNKRVFSLWLHNKTPRLHAQIGNLGNCFSFNSFKDNDNAINKFLNGKEYKLTRTAFDAALRNKEELVKFLNNND